MNNRPGQQVVVGIDGSESALRAVRWGAAEARRRGVGLRLVHGVVMITGYPPHVIDTRALHTALRDRGHAWLEDARDAAVAAAPELSVDTFLDEMSAVPLLIGESRDAALVVLGSRGLGGFTGLVLGSTAVELAGRAHSPIVVVRGEPDGEQTGPVVVGVDGTPAGEDAIAFAFAAASARGAELVAVHAWSDLVLEAAFAAGATAFALDAVRRQAEVLLAERLAGWQEKYPDVHVLREVVRESPAHALLRHAAQAQLLVVGTRGRGGFRGLLLGSTSQHLLHHATCPVAVVRTAGER